MTINPKNVSSEFLKIMLSRGFIQDCTDLAALDKELLSKGTPTAYVGYDATAESLHVGHLVNIMMLRWFQKCGGKPITLMGGGTTQIGDPSFRSDERPLLEIKKIEENIKSLKQIFSKYLEYDKIKNKALMVNNIDWLKNLEYLGFLRDFGRHFSINRMLSFDSVKSRLDRNQSLTFLEFNYMILQAYDFTELRRRYNCILQIGGSDQWGNIINGIDLTRKVLKEEIFGLTSPLLTTSDGKKMGKSQNGAIWLNKDLMSPYEFWQFWRNTSDQDVKKFLLLYTEIPTEECIALASLEGAKINEAKVVLANSVTSLCHGTDATEKAQQTSSRVFKNNDLDENLPAFELPHHELQPDISVIKLFVISGLSKSGKEVKRLITEKGLSYNNKIIDSYEGRLNRHDLQNPIKLSVGKKKHIMVKLKD